MGRSAEMSAAEMSSGLTNADLRPPGPLAPGALRVTALGGIGEIGRNMTVFEHLGRLLIIDCGVLFPSHDEPGVDLILPDLRHIADRLEDVEALVLTHAHEDHIGAIPFLLKQRADIPVVGSRFTLALVAAKCREHRIKPVLVEVVEGQRSTHGVFECEYFAVNHSIPDALAIAVHTGAGTILHTGDIKLDQLPLDGRPTDLPWGVIFPGAAAQDCPGFEGLCARHPSQLYQAAGEGLLLFLVLWLYSASPRPLRAVSAMFLVGYGTLRFMAEFFRTPDPGPEDRDGAGPGRRGGGPGCVARPRSALPSRYGTCPS